MQELLDKGWLVNLVLMGLVVFLSYSVFVLNKQTSVYKIENEQIKAMVINRDNNLNLFIADLKALQHDGVTKVLAKYNIK